MFGFLRDLFSSKRNVQTAINSAPLLPSADSRVGTTYVGPDEISGDVIAEEDGTFTFRANEFPEVVVSAKTQKELLDRARESVMAAAALRGFVGPSAAIELPQVDDDAQPLIRGFNEARRRDRSVHEALGLIKGILADGRVTSDEVMHLGRWLLANTGDCPGWPIDVLVQRVSSALEDGVVDAEECADLAAFFQELTSHGANAPLGRNAATRLPLTKPAPTIEFAGRTFVFTGKMIYGTRKVCERAVEERGGLCASTVSRKTDVLVIGFIGSEDWMFTSYGRKIEAAVEKIREGSRIAIVAEEHWNKHL
jgi:hypothetical protein